MHTALRSAAFLAVALAGCGTVTDPFFGVHELDRSRPPSNATQYACDGGKGFYLRLQDGAAWVILPEREFRLDKVNASSGARYANRAASLELRDDGASLVDAPDIAYTGCKPAPKS